MDNTPIYFAYSRHETRELAEGALEDYFAAGIVSEGERPKVSYSKIYRNTRKPWLVLFPAA